MPGIVGILSRRPAAECARLGQSMLATLQHESFYVSGEFAAPELGVWAGWVAHEYSFAAGQVFQNEQKDIALVFAGECFADLETIQRLKQAGHEIAATGGGWLVHLYEELGEHFFEKLNGLYSGLLIDRRRKQVFLFNDRYAMERIYWHETADAFYFASEAKALLCILPFVREFDPEGVAQYLALGNILESRTLFRGIQRLPGGGLWRMADGRYLRATYFSPALWEAQTALGSEEFEDRFADTFKKILPSYFAAKSKLGIALTGGLDTRMIMACCPRGSPRQATYTFAGRDGDTTLDDRIAARVAAACGLSHQLLRLQPDFFTDFAAHADRTVYRTDGVFGILGAHEIYFNRLARHLAPVRLTGNFGSEVLRGISTFKPQRLAPELFASGYAEQIAGAAGLLAETRKQTHPDTFATFKEIPWNLFGSVSAGRSQVTFRTPYLDNDLVALAYRMPEPLRRSSLPAARFIHATSPAMSAIPTDRGFTGHNSGPMFLARRIYAEVTFKTDYYYNEGLPRRVAAFNPIFQWTASRTGLAGAHKYLHYSRWFRNELAGYVNEKLSTAPDGPFWRPEVINRMFAEHRGGQQNFTPEINAVLTLEAVGRLLINRRWESGD